MKKGTRKAKQYRNALLAAVLSLALALGQTPAAVYAADGEIVTAAETAERSSDGGVNAVADSHAPAENGVTGSEVGTAVGSEAGNGTAGTNGGDGAGENGAAGNDEEDGITAGGSEDEKGGAGSGGNESSAAGGGENEGALSGGTESGDTNTGGGTEEETGGSTEAGSESGGEEQGPADEDESSTEDDSADEEGSDAEEEESGTTEEALSDLVKQIQELIDALPDADDITEENAEEVEALLDEISAQWAELTDEEAELLNIERYRAAIEALEALAGMSKASVRATAAAAGPVELDISNGNIRILDGEYCQNRANDPGEYITSLTNEYVITGTATGYRNYRIYIYGDASVTLRDLTIERTPQQDNPYSELPAMQIGDCEVNLKLEGRNILKMNRSQNNGYTGREALQISGSVTVSGDGSLEVTGGDSHRTIGNVTHLTEGGAGIYLFGDSTLTISDSVKITATGGNTGSVYTGNGYNIIGNGFRASPGSLLKVTSGSVDLGGGCGICSEGSINITGGTVRATGLQFNGILSADVAVTGGEVTVKGAAGNSAVYGGLGSNGRFYVSGGSTVLKLESGISSAIENVTAVIAPEDGYYGKLAENSRETYVFSEIQRGSLASKTVLTFEEKNTAYTVTLEDAGDGSSGAGQYFPGDRVTIKAGTKAGYRFDGWKVTAGNARLTDAGQTDTDFELQAGDVTLTAIWIPSYTIRVTDGTADPEQADYLEGEYVTLTAVNKENSENLLFDLWELTGGGTIADPYSDTTVFVTGSENAEIAAVYEQGYRLAVEGGTGSGLYRNREKVNISATVVAGQEFALWSQDGTLGNIGEPFKSATTFTMGAEDVTVTANTVSVKVDTGDFVVAGGILGTDYTYSGGVLTFKGSGSYAVSLREGIAQTSHCIVVKSGSPTIVLKDVSISNAAQYSPPFQVSSSGTVTLVLQGENVLDGSGGDHNPGLQKSGSGSLIITSIQGDGSAEGTLTAKGGRLYCAGIGGGSGESVKNITINGGTVTATARYGAGIGGGYRGTAENITVNGGVVNASSTDGAGIGGGHREWGDPYGRSITINGGKVTARSERGAGIGGGCGQKDGGSGTGIVINGGEVIAENTRKALGQTLDGMGIGRGGATAGDGNFTAEAEITVNGNPTILQGDASANEEASAADLAAGTKKYVHIIYEQAPVTDVTISPSAVSAYSGSSISFNAAVAGGSDPTLLWTVSGNESADTMIWQDGTLVIGADETAGLLTVTVTSRQDGNRSASAQVTVKTLETRLLANKTGFYPGEDAALTFRMNEAAEGTVQFYLDGRLISGRIAPVDNEAAFTVGHDLLTAGEHSVTAVFTGDGFREETDAVTITVNQKNVTVTQWPVAAEITYGQRLSDSALTGGKAEEGDTGEAINGSFFWADSSVKPAAGQHSYEVVFEADGVGYGMVTAEVSVIVKKAAPTVGWNDTKQELEWTGSEAAVAPPQIMLVNGESFAGEIRYFYKPANEPSAEYQSGLPTEVGSYVVKAEIEETDNYTAAKSSNTLTLTIQKQSASISFNDSYSPDKTYDGTAVERPSAEQLALTNTAYADIGFSWYAGSAEADAVEQNRLDGAPKDAGSYVLVAQAPETASTDGARAVMTVTIGKASLMVTVKDQTITYGENIEQGTNQVECRGLAEGDRLDSVLLLPGTDQATADSYIEASGVIIRNENDEDVSRNYNIGCEPGTLVILRAAQPVPEGLVSADETIAGKADGMITVLTETMEYSADGVTYTKVTDPAMRFAAGTWYIRYAEDENHHASEAAELTIAPGRMLQVTFRADGALDVVKEVKWNATLEEADIPPVPAREGYDQTAPYWADKSGQRVGSSILDIKEDMVLTAIYTINTYTVSLPENTIGYTVSGPEEKTVTYGSSYTFRFVLGEGYSETENFCISVNDAPVVLKEDGSYTIENIAADQTVTVAGVADITAPGVEIRVGTDFWKKLLNTITFEKFYPETQTVTIIAEDAGSGINTVQYVLSDTPLDVDAVKAVTEWEDYGESFSIDPNNRYVIYAKVTDHAGNTTYISSDGLVLDNVLPAVTGIENGQIYYGDVTFSVSDENLADVTVDEAAAESEDGEYTVTADNAEHVIVAADKAGNAVTYCITVYEIYTITFIADGAVVEKVSVNYGHDLNAEAFPAIPEKEGYTRITPIWDSGSLTNVTADKTVTAIYFKDQATEIPTEDPDSGKSLKLVVEPGLDEVPEAFLEIEELNTVEKLEAKLKLLAMQKNPSIREANTAVYEVILLMLTDEGWLPAGIEDYPVEGITITLPYPEGTGKNTHNFTIALMPAGGVLGSTPGDTEYPACQKTDEGLAFVINGPCLIGLGWTTVPKPAEDENGHSGEESGENEAAELNVQSIAAPVQSQLLPDIKMPGTSDLGGQASVIAGSKTPPTGDDAKLWLWFAGLAASCAAAAVLIFRRRKKKESA